MSQPKKPLSSPVSHTKAPKRFVVFRRVTNRSFRLFVFVRFVSPFRSVSACPIWLKSSFFPRCRSSIVPNSSLLCSSCVDVSFVVVVIWMGVTLRLGFCLILCGVRWCTM